MGSIDNRGPFLISLAMKWPNSFESVTIGRLPNDLNRASISGSRSTVAKARWMVAVLLVVPPIMPDAGGRVYFGKSNSGGG